MFLVKLARLKTNKHGKILMLNSSFKWLNVSEVCSMEVSTFICKREISGLSSPLNSRTITTFFICAFVKKSRSKFVNYNRSINSKILFALIKISTLIKANSNVFLWYAQCCSCPRRSKTKILTTRAPPSLIEFDVVTSHRQTRHLEYAKARKIVWESQIIDSSSRFK